MKSRLLVAMSCAVVVLAPVLGSPQGAGSNAGYLYGTVTTRSGNSHTGVLRWGLWSLLIGPPSIHEILYGQQMLILRPWNANLIYVVGSLDNETLTVLSKEVSVRRKIAPFWRRLLGDDGRGGASPGKIRPGS